MEMHNYAAPKFRKVIDSSSKYLLGLTATLKRKDGEHIRLIKRAPLIYRLPIETARKLGFVSDYQVYNLGVDFTDPTDKEAYKKAHSAFVSLYRFFGHDFDTMMSCVKGNGTALNYVATKSNKTVGEVQKYALMALRSMKKRKEILYEAQSKLPVVKELTDKLPGQTLIFTQTIDSCEAIVKELNSAKAYHSQVKGRQKRNGKKLSAAATKREIIENFEKAKFQRLVGAKALNEGFSVNAVELAIFFSYTSDIRTFVQRMGRAVRFVEGKKAKIVALYMKPFDHGSQKIHSQELKWLKDAQNTNIGSVKWVDSVDEIVADIPSLTF